GPARDRPPPSSDRIRYGGTSHAGRPHGGGRTRRSRRGRGATAGRGRGSGASLASGARAIRLVAARGRVRVDVRGRRHAAPPGGPDVTLFYLALLIALIAGCLVVVFVRPERVFEYPYFMATAFGVFILPQALSLVSFPGAASESAVSAVLLMSCLCLAGCILGYHIPPQPQLFSFVARPMRPTRLFHVGLFFVICGFAFDYLFRETEVEYSAAGGMTGRATLYLFFEQLVFP